MRKLRAFTLSWTLLFVAAVTVVPAQAGLITSLTGDQSFAPLVLGLDNPANAINVDGTLHITGFSNGIGARQLINLGTGVAGSVEQFHSLNGLGGRVGIDEVVRLDDDRVLYLGSGDLGANGATATYWIDGVVNPFAASVNPSASSRLEGASANGTFIGFDSGVIGNSAVGHIGSTLQALPVGGNGLALDITRDASFIVGTDNIWTLGQLGYENFSTAGFDNPANGDVPGGWQGVAIDPVTAQAVFAGEYLNLSTFQSNTGFWNEDGTLLGSFDGQFQDFEIWEGQLVAGLNGFDNDGYLLALGDFSALSIFDITGNKSILRENGLFVGSAGFLLDGPNGTIVTAYSTTAVPEPSSFLMFLLGSIGLWFKRRFRTVVAS